MNLAEKKQLQIGQRVYRQEKTESGNTIYRGVQVFDLGPETVPAVKILYGSEKKTHHQWTAIADLFTSLPEGVLPKNVK